MALTVVALGTGFGPVVFPPLIDYLADIYGWRGAILLSCGVYLHALICGLLFIPNTQIICRVNYIDTLDCEKMAGTIGKGQGLSEYHKEYDGQDVDIGRVTGSATMAKEEEDCFLGYEKSARPDEIERRVRMSNGRLADPPKEKIVLERQETSMDYKIFRKVSVICLLINAVFMGAGYNSFNDLFPAFVCSLGHSRAEAALALSASSAANVVGRLILGTLFIAVSRRFPPNRPLTLYIFAASGGGLILCLARVVQSYTSVIAYASIFGLIFGAHGSAFPNVSTTKLI